MLLGFQVCLLPLFGLLGLLVNADVEFIGLVHEIGFFFDSSKYSCFHLELNFVGQIEFHDVIRRERRRFEAGGVSFYWVYLDWQGTNVDAVDVASRWSIVNVVILWLL